MEWVKLYTTRRGDPGASLEPRNKAARYRAIIAQCPTIPASR
jgi:hypothetical protein